MYHLTEKGEPRPCNAKKGKCPYAQENHFESAVEARAAYEETQSNFLKLPKRIIPHEMKLSNDVVDLLNQLANSNLTPYIVGGSVRDSLISGEAPKDIDIEVFGAKSTEQLEKIVAQHGYKVDTVGESFGVLKFILSSGEDIDLSLPRRDSKTGDGHKGFDVQIDPSLTLEEAAGRRDFTINSLYYSHENKSIHDPYGGVADWNKRQLKHINEHFGEDPLRVLRGVQFAGRFSMELAPETAELTRGMKNEFNNLPADRIQTEFEKLFTKGDLQKGFSALKQTGWDEELKLSGVSHETIERSSGAVQRAKEFSEDITLFGTAGILSGEVESKDLNTIANNFLSGKKRQIKSISLAKEKPPKSHDEKTVRAWARDIRRRGLRAKDFYIFSGNVATREATEHYGIFEEADPDLVTGAKVLEASGGKPGPWIGNLMRDAAIAQDERIFIDEAGADSWLAKKISEIS